MAQTDGSSSWASLGASALGGVLSYEAGQANGVAPASDSFVNPDVASLYYGQNVNGQPTVGAAGGSSLTRTLIVVGVLGLLGFLAFKMVR